MELHQRKAVKKARRRRQIGDQRRIFTEEKDKRSNEDNNVGELKWAEKENELQKSQDERVNSKAKVETEVVQALKELKKKAKKERQAEKRRLLQQQMLEDEEREKAIEETVPAMVTIKRVIGGGNNSPTVEIKVSTPEDHKLIYTLINGSDNCKKTGVTYKVNKGCKNKKNPKTSIERLEAPEKMPQSITKELKVTVALDMINKQQNIEPPSTSPSTKPNMVSNTKKIVENKKSMKMNDTKQSPSHDDLLVPNSLIPPGITITKMDSSGRREQNALLKNDIGSMVTVAETEKLLRKGQGNNSPYREPVDSKRKTKKKIKIPQDTQLSTLPPVKEKTVSLTPEKNMIFDPLKSKFGQFDVNAKSCNPAIIFTNENGTVTVTRNSRLQQSSSDRDRVVSVPLRTISSQIKYPEIQKLPISAVFTNSQTQDPAGLLQAQEILSGLQEIQITKVDKKNIKPELKENIYCPRDQITIIPVSKNGREAFHFDENDWLCDSVFSPK
uniref:Transcriptional regulator ATRX homolog isoform X1 n=2 Tax=Diabrotica virgifera virgifera TaxID=50390 RepID=A0A6P7F7C6_DIAVI